MDTAAQWTARRQQLTICIALAGAVATGAILVNVGADGSAWGFIPALIGGAILGAIYFAPAISAHLSSHRNFNAILVLNALLGWTFIGWAIAFVWAVKKD